MKQNRFLYATVFAVGISTLGAEIAAARLLAPFFGASTIVWANTIGVVLVALSAGYWYGGKLGDRYPDVRKLCMAVLVGSVLLTLIPFVAQPFFEVAISALDQIEAGAFVGSLFAVLFLVAIPLAVLGTASPWAIRLSVDEVENAGAVAGRLYAISTVGSLLGTMLSALLLIPFAGTQRTFIIFGVMLALVAAFGLGKRYLFVPALVAATLAIPVGAIKSTEDGEVLFETDSEHQYIRVIEEADGDRLLELNEGQAVHSLLRADSNLTGDVWDGYLVLPFAALSEPPERIAILGNAAGTTARAYGEYLPETEIDGVEIDPELEEVGNRYFDMASNEQLEVFSEDARPWLRRSEGGYDAIFVDAYRQPYIPFYLATEEFFALVRERLAPGGVVVVNAGHPEGNDDLEKVLGRTLAEVFPNVMRDPIEPTNTLLVASESELNADGIREATAELPLEVANLGATEASRFGELLPGGRVYSDDLAPVEWLIDRSILGYAGEASE
ncbi:MAG: fused MFS/spermidine synthase [Actinomycetota bacterium]|nr:fused MFS/spermidine synthase [Actinomycetota bacterium]